LIYLIFEYKGKWLRENRLKKINKAFLCKATFKTKDCSFGKLRARAGFPYRYRHRYRHRYRYRYLPLALQPFGRANANLYGYG
jgi:hypothetical protein